MKAITPVIATVMLLLVTVGVVGVSYSWLNGLFSSQTKNSISIPSGGAYCSNGEIKVHVLNTGNSPLTTSGIILAQVDGNDILNTPFIGDMGSYLSYWKFDEVAGSVAADSSGNGNNGAVSSNTNWAAGKVGGALNFFGSDLTHPSYVSASVSSGSLRFNTPFTIEMWINPTDTASCYAGECTLFARSSATQSNLVYVALSPGANTIRFAGSGFDFNGNYAIQLGKWTHVALNYDGVTAKIFVNGALDNSKPGAGFTDSGSAGTLYIATMTNSARYYRGVMDDLKVYNKNTGTFNIQPGNAAVLVNYPATEGRHQIKIGTSSGVSESTVTC
ncbi:MAG: LamG domain-containing protein [Candidatus Aenigmarchaeota archaeon]|nr:LamG domain-containing protein [Candidatus Aenigmarchaeota archaeon]